MEKDLRIILIAPRSISKHETSEESFRLDYAYWNFYIPLLELGHKVIFFDTSKFGNIQLKKTIEDFKPNLLFGIMTGSSYYCPDEPWDTILEETKKGNIKTFNWFCDDTWRFDSFSKIACSYFHSCSTPESNFVSKYKNIGYNNIIYATWHANPNLYSIDRLKLHKVSFVGRIDAFRIPYIEKLKQSSINVNIPKNVSFEDLINTYSASLIGLNFSKTSTGNGTQIKARAFEVPACKSLLISEHSEELSKCFNDGEEVLLFKNENELLEKLKILDDQKLLQHMTMKGYMKFLNNHTSHIRLRKLLEDIFK